jgi:hypothetical protein
MPGALKIVAILAVAVLGTLAFASKAIPDREGSVTAFYGP